MKENDKGMSALGCGLVWFGAAVSIAEIEAGAALAPAAVGGRGWSVLGAILLGHLFGGAMLFLAMLLGARTRRGGMDCAKVPFGRAGGGFFAALNLLQLVGWTAVMVAQGAGAARELLGGDVPFAAICAGIGVLVAVWIYVGLRGVGRINSVAMILLFALTVLLFATPFVIETKGTGHPTEPMPGPVFWFAFEMSVAMPLSWLPLAADYTKDARRPVAACAVAALVYSIASCWMYGIGMLAATYGSISAAFQYFGAAGLGAAALLVIVFSTVTTTFLDAYSAGESAKSLWSRIPAKPFGVAVCALGTLLAAFGAMDRYLDFLYLIASVFAPMAAVLLVDGFLARRRQGSADSACNSSANSGWNLFAWAAGFAVYHACLGGESPLAAAWPSAFGFLGGCSSPAGATIPAMAASALLALPAAALALARRARGVVESRP
jgi:putative hydroxymethylpyrimidine transporter CytX